MIRKRRWLKIKRGDLVLWNGRPRIVLWGPADDLRCGKMTWTQAFVGNKWCHVVFAYKNRSSYTGTSAYGFCTLYDWTQCKRQLTIPEDGEFDYASVKAEEQARLKRFGLNLKKCFILFVRERNRMNESGYFAPKTCSTPSRGIWV